MIRLNVRFTGTAVKIAVVMSIALLLAVAAAVADDGKKKFDWELHGFASVGYMDSSKYNYLTDSLDGSTDFAEIGLNFSFGITRDLRIGAQVFARELGELGNYDPEIDWLFLDWRPMDEVGARLGRFKMPYGLYNQSRDIDVARTAIFLPQALYDERMRDYFQAVDGVNLYGEAGIASAGRLEYQLYYGKSYMETDGSVAQIIASSGVMTLGDADSDTSYGASLVWNTPVEGLRFGLSQNRWEWDFLVNVDPMLQAMGYPATATLTSDDLRTNVVSAEYVFDKWMFAGEYSTQDGTFESDFYPHIRDREGWYLLGSYQVTDRIEVGSYYSDSIDDPHQPTESPDFHYYQKDWAVSGRFDLSMHWVVKLEAHRVDGVGLLLPYEMPEGETDKTWGFYAAKVSYFF